MTWIFVWIWWFIGAITRFFITKWASVFGTHFPYGTLIVNLLWSFIIWVLFSLFEEIPSHIDPRLKSLLTTWFLWALTTYSTFALESFFMLDRWNYHHFLSNIFLNLFWTILFAGLGFYLVKIIFRWLRGI